MPWLNNYKKKIYAECNDVIIVTNLFTSLIYRLWEEQAGSFDYFAKEGAFKGKSLAEAKGCGGELAAQAKAFGNLVGDWVNNINDAGKLKSLCDAFAAKHKARNISAAQIQVRDIKLFHLLCV